MNINIWYQKIVTYDISVWRLFKRVGPDITPNITKLYQVNNKGILFLNPQCIVIVLEKSYRK